MQDLMDDGAARGGTRPRGGRSVGFRARIARLFHAQPTHEMKIVAAELAVVAARRFLQRLHLDLVTNLSDHERRHRPQDVAILDQHLHHVCRS